MVCKMIFDQNYNEMSFIQQVNMQHNQGYFNRYTLTHYANLPYTQHYRINTTSKRQQNQLGIQTSQQRQQRETLQSKAKTHLFEQSEVYNHKEVNKSYELMKKANKKVSKSMMLQTEQQITAFEYEHQPVKKSSSNLYRNQFTKSNQSNPPRKRELRFQIPNHQIYWNKKQHAQVMILRPTLINPNMLNNERADSVSKNSSDHESSGKKDFQKIMNKLMKSSQEGVSSANYNTQKYKKRARIRSIEKKLINIRSKSTNFIEEYQRTQLLNEFQKATDNCAFELQIKCLQSQKQLIDANKTKTVKSNKDLKQKIRHLITKQSKSNLHNQTNKQKANQSLQDLSIKNESKAQKLQVIQNRSKSCFVPWKGGENKKIKIGHILSKFAKFKTEQLQNKRRMVLQNQSEQRKSVQLLRINLKVNEQVQKQRENVLKLQQARLDPDSKKGLINSIKLYCSEKHNEKLPFVTTLLANNSINIRP